MSQETSTTKRTKLTKKKFSCKERRDRKGNNNLNLASLAFFARDRCFVAFVFFVVKGILWKLA